MRCWQRARAAETRLAALDEAASEGLAVARQSVFRRHQLSTVQAYADLQEPLDRASRNLRVLVATVRGGALAGRAVSRTTTCGPWPTWRAWPG